MPSKQTTKTMAMVAATDHSTITPKKRKYKQAPECKFPDGTLCLANGCRKGATHKNTAGEPRCKDHRYFISCIVEGCNSKQRGKAAPFMCQKHGSENATVAEVNGTPSTTPVTAAASPTVVPTTPVTVAPPTPTTVAPVTPTTVAASVNGTVAPVTPTTVAASVNGTVGPVTPVTPPVAASVSGTVAPQTPPVTVAPVAPVSPPTPPVVTSVSGTAVEPSLYQRCIRLTNAVAAVTKIAEKTQDLNEEVATCQAEVDKRSKKTEELLAVLMDSNQNIIKTIVELGEEERSSNENKHKAVLDEYSSSVKDAIHSSVILHGKRKVLTEVEQGSNGPTELLKDVCKEVQEFLDRLY